MVQYKFQFYLGDILFIEQIFAGKPIEQRDAALKTYFFYEGRLSKRADEVKLINEIAPITIQVVFNHNYVDSPIWSNGGKIPKSDLIYAWIAEYMAYEEDNILFDGNPINVYPEVKGNIEDRTYLILPQNKELLEMLNDNN